jgi:putative aldouronate transport system permease protein
MVGRSAMKRYTTEDIIFSTVNYSLLTAVALACLYPMVHVLFASISDPIRLMQHTGVMLWPKGFSLKGYRVVIENPNIGSGYMNTLIYTFVGTALSVFFSSMGAYALSRKNFMFKRTITLLIVFTMYFSGGLIPNFLLVKNIGLYNSRWAVMLPVLIGTWNLIVMRTSFQQVPPSLEESAKIDGANDFVILFRIFIPVQAATIAVMILFYSVAQWNSWFNAMIYLRDRSLYPLQLFLREILIANSTSGNINPDSDVLFLEEVIKNATIIVATLPILCVYPFVQKYFIKGVMLGSVKE